MRKAVVVAVMALTVALALTPIAAAKGAKHAGHAKGKAKFCLVGTAIIPQAVDPAPEGVDPQPGTEIAVADVPVLPAPQTLSVLVKAGTKTVKVYRGKELQVRVAETAKIRLVTADGCVDAQLGDILDGAKIKMRGRVLAGGIFEATFIKVKNPVEPPMATEPADPVLP